MTLLCKYKKHVCNFVRYLTPEYGELLLWNIHGTGDKSAPCQAGNQFPDRRKEPLRGESRRKCCVEPSYTENAGSVEKKYYSACLQK